MLRQSSISRCAFALLTVFTALAHAHTVITYPGWRGDNLHSSGTVEQTDGMIQAASNNSDSTDGTYWPYGMQWEYPCGGMPTSTNRTKWPVKGGAIALQPGWFPGHATAFFYINMGFGTVPANMSNPMLPVFQIDGPTKDPYPGSFCLPQVPLPVNASVKVGDNATIQIIETAVHGAGLYNCVDITFAEPEDVAEVNSTNCFNSSQITFEAVYSTVTQSAAPTLSSSPAYMALTPLLFAVIATLLS